MTETEKIVAQLKADSPDNQMLHDLIDSDQKDNAFKRFALTRRIRGQATSLEFKEDRPACEYDGVPIYKRKFENEIKVNHRLHTPIGRRVVATMVGYLSGITVKYEDESGDIQQLLDAWGREQSIESTHGAMVKAAASTGTGFAMLKQADAKPMLVPLNAWETIVIANQTTGEPELALRYWKMDVIDQQGKQARWYVELYDSESVRYFLEDRNGVFTPMVQEYPELVAQIGAESVVQRAGSRLHFFDGVPIVEFPHNADRIGDAELTLSLQDAYDVSLSDLSAELAQLRNSYLSNTDGQAGTIDSKFVEQLKQTGILKGAWAFVERSPSAEAIGYLQNVLRKNAFDFSNSVDFADPQFNGNMPIIAFMLKLKGLDDSATEIVQEFDRAWRRIFAMLLAFWTRLKLIPSFDASLISLNFKRNVPLNQKEMMDTFVNAGGKLSNETLLSMLPFVANVQAEMERIKTEQENEYGPGAVQDTTSGQETA